MFVFSVFVNVGSALLMAPAIAVIENREPGQGNSFALDKGVRGSELYARDYAWLYA